MKKTISILLALTLALGLLSGCGGQESASNSSGTAQTGRLSIVTTIFPVYDWVMNLLGEEAANADVTMLLDSGVDLHSYQPTVDDMVRIATCDLFIYVGGESDAWVEDALKEAVNENMVVLNLLDLLGDAAREEEIVAGMEAEEEDEEAGPAYDEHVWLSLKNAVVLSGAIANALGSIDPARSGVYNDNLIDYVAQLEVLDAAYAAAVDAGRVKTVLFGDRFPFRYLVDDYGLDYFAAFVGCSAETEASFETIVFLAGEVDTLDLHAILQIESADGSIARTIRDNTATKDQQILTLNSMQSTTSKDVADGASYLAIMEANLGVLTAALA